MSAWTVSKQHIDCIVTGAIRLGLVDRKEATKIGKLLWTENYRSVNARYNESNRRPTYEYAAYESTDGFLCKQVHCYDYQTCEHDGWRKSRAYRLCQAILAEFPDIEATSDYESARWGA